MIGKVYYEMQKDGMTYGEIERRTGAKSRNVVAGAILRYREKTGLPPVSEIEGSTVRPALSAKRAPRKKIRQRATNVAPKGLSLLDLRANQCRYPYGSKTYTLCGHDTAEGESYCPEHKALCVTTRQAKRERDPLPQRKHLRVL